MLIFILSHLCCIEIILIPNAHIWVRILVAHKKILYSDNCMWLISIIIIIFWKFMYSNAYMYISTHLFAVYAVQRKWHRLKPAIKLPKDGLKFSLQYWSMYSDGGEVSPLSEYNDTAGRFPHQPQMCGWGNWVCFFFFPFNLNAKTDSSMASVIQLGYLCSCSHFF